MPFGYRKRPVKAVITYPTRILGQVYQNTTGRPIVVIATVTCLRASVPAAFAKVICYVEDDPTPAIVTARVGLGVMDNFLEDVDQVITFAVPNGWYYSIVESVAGAGSSATLVEWTEVEL